jgi:hypothetical protein
MSLLIPKITTQERFPWGEDLTEKNMGMLAVMLSDPKLLWQLHDQAEKAVYLYERTHRALRTAASQLPGEDTNQIASIFNRGIAIYEAMCVLANPTAEHTGRHQIWYIEANAGNVEEAKGPAWTQALQDAEEELRTKQPRAWQVVCEATERSYPGLGHYGLYGAGIARELELAAI